MRNVNEIIRVWIILNIVFVCVYNYCVVIHFPKHVTISDQLRSVVTQYPALLLLIGIVLGHLFWKE